MENSDNNYFHLLNTEEDVKFALNNYGIDSVKLVLSNLISDIIDLSEKIDQGLQSMKMIQEILHTNIAAKDKLEAEYFRIAALFTQDAIISNRYTMVILKEKIEKRNKSEEINHE